MYCQNCGTQNESTSKFCRKCGAELWKTIYEKKSPIKKKHTIKRVIAFLLVVVITISTSITIINMSSRKKKEVYCACLSDNGLLVFSDRKKEPFVIDRSITKLFNEDEPEEQLGLFEDYWMVKYIPTCNKLFYATDFSFGDRLDFNIAFMDLNDEESIQKLPFDTPDIEHINYSKSGKIYFNCENIIYSYDFDSVKKIAENIQYWWINADKGRIVYEGEYLSDDYFSDIYTIDENGNSKNIANYVRLIHFDENNDIYVYYDRYGQVYTLINGVNNKVEGLFFEIDDSVTWDIEYCGENGNLIIEKRTAYTEYFSGYSHTTFDYSYYSYIKGKIEEISDFGSISNDGTVLCRFNKENYDSSTVLYKYELKNDKYVKTNEYADVYDYEITKYNDLLLLRNHAKINDVNFYDLYYNDTLVDNNICLSWVNNHKLFDIDVLSENLLCYRTDMRYEDGWDTYTLNIYDGNKTKEIAYNVDDYHFWTDDNCLIYIGDRNWNTLKGTLKMYDGKKTKVLLEDVYAVSSIYGNEY